MMSSAFGIICFSQQSFFIFSFYVIASCISHSLCLSKQLSYFFLLLTSVVKLYCDGLVATSACTWISMSLPTVVYHQHDSTSDPTINLEMPSRQSAKHLRQQYEDNTSLIPTSPQKVKQNLSLTWRPGLWVLNLWSKAWWLKNMKYILSLWPGYHVSWCFSYRFKFLHSSSLILQPNLTLIIHYKTAYLLFLVPFNVSGLCSMTYTHLTCL